MTRMPQRVRKEVAIGNGRPGIHQDRASGAEGTGAEGECGNCKGHRFPKYYCIILRFHVKHSKWLIAYCIVHVAWCRLLVAYGLKTPIAA